MKGFLGKAKMKYVLVLFPTTVENIVRYFLDAISARLRKTAHLHRISVRVHETHPRMPS